MAPLVRVPADFGRRHIGQPSQGDFSFQMADGDAIRAHSIALSLNSPFFRNLYENFKDTSVDASQFSRDAVDCLIESCYSGEVDALSIEIFEEVYKMSSEFKIGWLTIKCEDFCIRQLLKFDINSSFIKFEFLVQQAVNQITFEGDRGFLNLVVEKLSDKAFHNKRNLLLKEYTANINRLSDVKISACIEIAGADKYEIVESLIRHFKRNDVRSIDKLSWTFLQNIDLRRVHKKFPTTYVKLLQSLCNDISEYSSNDCRLLLSICKEAAVCPLNFGTDHSRTHSSGCFNFTLENGDVVIKANPFIMSMNSPVIENITVNERVFKLHVNEFCSDAVHVFIESCYKGKLEGVHQENFRDIFTMSNKLKVYWLVTKCKIKYSKVVKKLNNKSSYVDLRFAAEEAKFQLETYKKNTFLNLIAAQLNNKVLTPTREKFIRRYIGDFSGLSSTKFELCFAIVRSDLCVLVEALISYLREHDGQIVQTLKNCKESFFKHVPFDFFKRNVDLRRQFLHLVCSARIRTDGDDIQFIISELRCLRSIELPLDFGRLPIGNVYQEPWCLFFTVTNGEPITANPIVLCLNSPVIEYLVTDLHQNILEADDFSRNAIDCFIETCCTGKLDTVTIETFRDVYKMSHAFKINWLKKECEAFFSIYVDTKFNQSCQFADFQFAVEQALYQQEMVKKDSFLRLVIKSAKSNILPERRITIIQKYLFNLMSLSTAKIDVCLAMSSSDIHLILEILIHHLQDANVKGLDSNSRYLLNNLDLALCFRKKPELRQVLFAALQDLSEVRREDFRLILDLCKKLSQS